MVKNNIVHTIILFICISLVISCKSNPSSSEEDSNSDNSSIIEFKDDFSSNNFNWEIYSGNWFLENEALFIDGPNDTLQHVAYYKTKARFTQPFNYSVEVCNITGVDKNSLYGIGLWNPERAIVYFIDDSNQKYCVSELTNNGWNILIDWLYYSRINRGPSSMKMIYESDSLKLYYNDKKFFNSLLWVNESFDEFILYHQGTEKIKFDNVEFTGTVQE